MHLEVEKSHTTGRLGGIIFQLRFPTTLIVVICCNVKNSLSCQICLLLHDDADYQPVQFDQILPSLPPSGREEMKIEDFQETDKEEKYDDDFNDEDSVKEEKYEFGDEE